MSPDRRDELLVAACFGLAGLAAAGFVAAYATAASTQLEGLALGAALLLLAAGLTFWAHRLLPVGLVRQAREPLASPPPVDAALEEDLRRGDLSRRHLIRRSLALALAGLGASLVVPFRSLGPSPGHALTRTGWGRGRVRLVTSEGVPVKADDVPLAGLLTAVPDGEPGSADGQVVVLRVDPSLLRLPRGREGWAPDGLLAYSKVCTHAGCPVGLYQAQDRTLLCPCHQSAFDVLRGAQPVGGPASARLPQLPLAVDPDGTLVGTGELSGAVGPGFWHRS
jgi:ubiquinol-cytochrome c reductase iron-sulfur subunit